MNSIVFSKTSNIFLNSGIIALNYYLDICKNKSDKIYDYTHKLTEDELKIECKELFPLLKEVYYVMGKELYDTSGKNAKEKEEKHYFKKEPFKASRMAKMKTYGIAALITNDQQPISKNKNDADKFIEIFKEEPDFAKKIAETYLKDGKKLKGFDILNSGKVIRNNDQKSGDSKIYLNEPYIKITRLDDFDKRYFERGDKKCYLTGESFKKLVEVKSTSPFLSGSGLKIFDSYLKETSRKISWKAMYLSRFSPKLGLYSYTKGLDSLMCYYFDSDNLINLNEIFHQNLSFYKDERELINNSYESNFKLYNFSEQNEILFMLIYTFYKQFFIECELQTSKSKKYSLMGDSDLEDLPPVSLITFKADKFASTMRPNSFETFNHFRYIIGLISFFEKNELNIQQVLSSLKFLKKSQNEAKNKYRLERQIRNKILGNILSRKSISSELSNLFYKCYSQLIARDSIKHKYKQFHQLMKLAKLYEPIINFGGNLDMNKEIQEKAIKLGISIGMEILKFENSERKPGKDKENARQGRKYVIGLNKSGTLEKFCEAIVRIQSKYCLVISKELIQNLSENNFECVRNFVIIGALNTINPALQNKPQNA